MNKTTLLSVALASLLLNYLNLQEAAAQRRGFFQPELRSVPLLDRPNRPGHFFGNAIRNRAEVQTAPSPYAPPVRSASPYRGQAIPSPYQSFYAPQPQSQPSRRAARRSTAASPSLPHPVQSRYYAGGGYVAQPYNVTIDSRPVFSNPAPAQRVAPVAPTAPQTSVIVNTPTSTSSIGSSVLSPQPASANQLGQSVLVNP